MLFGMLKFFGRDNTNTSYIIRQKMLEWEFKYEAEFKEAIDSIQELKILKAVLQEKNDCKEEKNRLLEELSKKAPINVVNQVRNIMDQNTGDNRSKNYNINVENSPGTNIAAEKSTINANLQQNSEHYPTSDDVKNLMKNLWEKIDEIEPSTNPKEVQTMVKNFKRLDEDIVQEESGYDGNQTTLQRIKDAALNIGEIAKPIVEIVLKLMPLLIPPA